MRRLLAHKRHVLYATCCWLVLLTYILTIPPTNLIAFIPFYVLLFAALHTSLLLRLPQKMALLLSSAICVYLLLRQFRLDSLFTMILFLGTLATSYMFLRLPTRRRFGK